MVKFRAWLVGVTDVRKGTTQEFIQKFAISLTGLNPKQQNLDQKMKSNRSLMVTKMMTAQTIGKVMVLTVVEYFQPTIDDHQTCWHQLRSYQSRFSMYPNYFGKNGTVFDSIFSAGNFRWPKMKLSILSPWLKKPYHMGHIASYMYDKALIFCLERLGA